MKFLKTLILTVMLASPITAFALGGSIAVPGIDVIIKEAGIAAKHISFTPNEMRAVNKLKGLEKPAMIAKIAERKVKKMPLVIAPIGGWYSMFKTALVKEWCFECNGGKTTIRATSAKTGKKYVVTIRLKPGKLKPSISKMKAKADVKSMVKKK